MLISVATPVENSGSTTFAWHLSLELRKYLLSNVSSGWIEDRVYYIEADMSGGYLGYVLKKMGIERKHVNGMLSALDDPSTAVANIENYMWAYKNNQTAYFYSLFGSNTSKMGKALAESEKELAFYLDTLINCFIVADCGKVVHDRRVFILEADVQIWVASFSHSSSWMRLEHSLKHSAKENVKKYVLLTGDVNVYPEAVSDKFGVESFVLPDVDAALGEKPAKKYNEAVQFLTKKILKESKDYIVG